MVLKHTGAIAEVTVNKEGPNNFLVSHPQINEAERTKAKLHYSELALKTSLAKEPLKKKKQKAKK